jgi:uncharacterized membrane protein YczE
MTIHRKSKPVLHELRLPDRRRWTSLLDNFCIRAQFGSRVYRPQIVYVHDVIVFGVACGMTLLHLSGRMHNLNWRNIDFTVSPPV